MDSRDIGLEKGSEKHKYPYRTNQHRQSPRNLFAEQIMPPHKVDGHEPRQDHGTQLNETQEEEDLVRDLRIGG